MDAKSNKKPSEVTTIDDLRKAVRASEEMYRNFVHVKMTEIQGKYPFCTESVCDWIWTMAEETIDKIDLNNIDEILTQIGIDRQQLNNVRKQQAQMRMSLVEFTKLMIRDVQKDLTEMLAQKRSLDSLKADIVTYENQIQEYMTTEEYKMKKKEEIERLEQTVEEEPDEATRENLRKQLDIVKGLNYCDYLLDRIRTYGDKEIDSAERSFFSAGSGSLVMSKFRAAAKKLGIVENVYTFFLGLEERFLPEEYAPFNNFFLHICMKYIAYADLTDDTVKMYVQNIFNRLRMLFTHSFETEGDEKMFLHTITDTLDPFMKDVEKFKERNTSYKAHPDRLAREERVEKSRKEEFLKRLEFMGVTITDPILTMDSISLENLYKETLEKKNQLLFDGLENALNDLEENAAGEVVEDDPSEDPSLAEVPPEDILEVDDVGIDFDMDIDEEGPDMDTEWPDYLVADSDEEAEDPDGAILVDTVLPDDSPKPL